MNKLFLALLFLCSNSLFSQVKINGRDLSSMVKPNEIVICSFEGGKNVSFSCDGSNIQIGSFLDDGAEIKGHWNSLINNKSKLSSMCVGKFLRMSSGLSANYDHAYLSAKEGIFIKAGTDLIVHDSILESPSIFFTSNRFDIRSFVKDCAFLQFEMPSETSPIEIIRFVFAEHYSLPFAVEGEINVEKGLFGQLIALGVVRVEIKFREAAFK